MAAGGEGAVFRTTITIMAPPSPLRASWPKEKERKQNTSKSSHSLAAAESGVGYSSLFFDESVLHNIECVWPRPLSMLSVLTPFLLVSVRECGWRHLVRKGKGKGREV